MKMMINDLVYARGVNAPLRQAVLMMQAEMVTLTAKLAESEAEAMKYKLATSKNADALRETKQQLAEAQMDAERYRNLRLGQNWSVIDGIGDTLRADDLDEAIDALITRNIAMARSAADGD